MVLLIEVNHVVVDQDINSNKTGMIFKIIINNKMIIIHYNKGNEVEAVIEVVIVVVIEVVIVETIEIINNSSMNNNCKIQISILHYCQIRHNLSLMYHIKIDEVVVDNNVNGMLVTGMVKH
jgi:hypothetical protein